MRKNFIIMDSFELQTSRAKVDKQPNLHFVGFEVIHRLGEMDVFQLNDGFEFDHNEFLDEEVHAAGADFDSAVEDVHFLFALEGKALKGHFDHHRPLVDHFLESISQRGVDFHRGGDDAAS